MDSHHSEGACIDSTNSANSRTRGPQWHLNGPSDPDGPVDEQLHGGLQNIGFKQEGRRASLQNMVGSAAGRARLPGRPSPQRVFRALDAAYLAATSQLSHNSILSER
jgi:hypothetical protein